MRICSRCWWGILVEGLLLQLIVLTSWKYFRTCFSLYHPRVIGTERVVHPVGGISSWNGSTQNRYSFCFPISNRGVNPKTSSNEVGSLLRRKGWWHHQRRLKVRHCISRRRWLRISYVWLSSLLVVVMRNNCEGEKSVNRLRKGCLYFREWFERISCLFLFENQKIN